jgi:hypothetical protein
MSQWTNCIYHLVAVSALLICSGATASDYFTSRSAPSDQVIIEKAKTFKNCTKNIKAILGKHSVLPNQWTVWYLYAEPGGKTYSDNEMELLRLDNDRWVLKCGNGLSGTSWGLF